MSQSISPPSNRAPGQSPNGGDVIQTANPVFRPVINFRPRLVGPVTALAILAGGVAAVGADRAKLNGELQRQSGASVAHYGYFGRTAFNVTKNAFGCKDVSPLAKASGFRLWADTVTAAAQNFLSDNPLRCVRAAGNQRGPSPALNLGSGSGSR